MRYITRDKQFFGTRRQQTLPSSPSLASAGRGVTLASASFAGCTFCFYYLYFAVPLLSLQAASHPGYQRRSEPRSSCAAQPVVLCCSARSPVQMSRTPWLQPAPGNRKRSRMLSTMRHSAMTRHRAARGLLVSPLCARNYQGRRISQRLAHSKTRSVVTHLQISFSTADIWTATWISVLTRHQIKGY